MANLVSADFSTRLTGFLSRLDRSVWLFVTALLLLFLAFGEAIGNLVHRWSNSPDYGHGFFIPLISVWLLWERRALLFRLPHTPSAWGVPVLGAACFLLLSGQMTHIFVLQHIGLILGLVAIILLLGGKGLLRQTLLPIAYLSFMIPLPYFANYLLTSGLQSWASQLGALLIRAMGIPVLLNGNIIDLGVLKLAVAEACSGLRYMFPLLSLGFLAAYMFRAPLWQRLVLFLATIPVTIVMNSFRIALTAYFSTHYGADYAQGFSHALEGWMVFLLCGTLLISLGVLMSRVLNGRTLLGSFALPVLPPPALPDRSSHAGAGRHVGLMGACLTLLICAAVVHLGVKGRLFIPERQTFATLPLAMADWTVLRTHRLEQGVEEALGADDYVIADFVGQTGVVNLYGAYLNAQRDGRSWHSPRQCLPSGGWIIEEIRAHQLLDDTKARMWVNRVIIKRGTQRQLVYYWFEQRGRRITDELALKFYLIADTVSRSRSDGALMRLITPLEPGEDASQADARLGIFLRDLLPILPTYVPV